jgi:hypothetical protein
MELSVDYFVVILKDQSLSLGQFLKHFSPVVCPQNNFNMAFISVHVIRYMLQIKMFVMCVTNLSSFSEHI